MGKLEDLEKRIEVLERTIDALLEPTPYHVQAAQKAREAKLQLQDDDWGR